MAAALPPWLEALGWAVLKATIALSLIGFLFMFLVWLERKVAARIGRRVGPYRVGRPHGWLQLIADAVKMFSKEDVRPAQADPWVWALAPVVTFAPTALIFAILPVAPGLSLGRDLNIGLVYLSAVSSFTLVGLFMAGWGSNNKYSLIGAMRAAAQLMAYEVPLVLSLIGVAVMAGSLSLQEIIAAQDRVWFVFPQILGFVVFLVAGIAELNRVPFDLSEAESELVAGYATEYSGMRWGMFFFAEYANMFALSLIGAALFLGGWHGPGVELSPWIGTFWLLVKTMALVLVMMWVRWTLPRVRVDQLMDLGWKFLLPVSLVNLTVTGILVI